MVRSAFFARDDMIYFQIANLEMCSTPGAVAFLLAIECRAVRSRRAEAPGCRVGRELPSGQPSESESDRTS